MPHSLNLSILDKKTQQDLFHLVAKLVRETPSSQTVYTSNDDKLRLYGLYKHVTEGSCSGERFPSVFHAVARAKYQAWMDCRGCSLEDAISEYIHLVSSRSDALGQKCQTLIAEFVVNGNTTMEDSIQPSLHQSSSNKLDNRVLPFNLASTNVPLSFVGKAYFWVSSIFIQLCQLVGIHPLLPRGRLDISYRDLLYAIFQCCLWWRWTPHHCQHTSRKIRQLWGQEGTIAGLSVRSLLDLYLTTKNFPEGSQVVVSPPISVPGMMHVLRYHNIDIVPVDLTDGQESKWCNISAIRHSITSKTIAIMVVHPFGMIGTSGEELESLRNIADEHSIELWEDCAECFMGLGEECYLGNSLADVRFFSFGMIKTVTALGGGVAILRDVASRHNMERLQNSFSHVQSTFSFFRRILLALILNVIADSSWRVGVLAKVCSLIGMEFDQVVTNSLRGFRIQSTTSSETERAVQKDLILQIRKRPSNALLTLLHRRLFQCKNQIAPSVSDRMVQCAEMKEMLSQMIPRVIIRYGSNQLNTYWAFPILCSNRDKASRILVEQGFDVVSGASQLCCVSSFASEDYPCPNATKLMNSILYVPVASQKLFPDDLERLVEGIKDAIDIAERHDDLDGDIHTLIAKGSTKQSQSTILLAGIPVVLALIPRIWLIDIVHGTFCLGTMMVAYIFVGVLIAIICLYFLRAKTATMYLEGSTAFAEHCDMIDAATSQQAHSHENTQCWNQILSKMDCLRLTRISQLCDGRTIILTGATGFVGSLLLRDLLLERERLSLKRIILISRGKKGETATSRISRQLRKPMYSFLSEEKIKQYVEVLSGDVTQVLAGLSDEDLGRILNDVTITHVFHCAAAVSFTQELPDAARSNITSSLNMQALTARLYQQRARFIYISTAFIHGRNCGLIDSPLSEELFPLSPFQAEKIYNSMLGTQFYASKAMTELGFPNSYTLSKCVSEHLLIQQKAVETIIIRPSIVCPSVESPFEGWAGEKPTTIVAGACLHLLNQWNIWCLEPNSVPYIPVDVLSRFIMVKAFYEPRMHFVDSDAASSSDGSFERLSQQSSDVFSESEDSTSKESKEVASIPEQRIFHATWDSSSASARFSWLEFSVSYLQLGCVLGYFNRSLAYVTLFVSAQLTPQLCSKDETYHQLHAILVRWPINFLSWFLENMSISTSRIKNLLPFLDLPLLFFPFVRRTYYFRSELSAPSTFRANRYVFSIGVAAHRFIAERKTVEKGTNQCRTLSFHNIGGASSVKRSADFWWAASQPRGNWAVRITAWIVVKILRLVCSDVTIDLVSFRAIQVHLRDCNTGDNKYLILAPTHRSFLDFVLISYAIFSLPELQLDIPYIIAADEFSYLPFVGMFAQMLRSVYIRRGRGQQDPTLNETLSQLKKGDLLAKGACLEVFLEGTRSRDRRFLKPKTGILKCLDQTGGSHVVVPITINYEQIPEQELLSSEASGLSKHSLNVSALFSWLKNAIAGRIALGKIHIVASTPLCMECESREDFALFTNNIQQHHQNNVFLSNYHLRTIGALLQLHQSVIADAMSRIGCKFWPSLDHDSSLSLPDNQSEMLSIALQAGHLLSPLFYKSHPNWARWLNHLDACETSLESFDENTSQIHQRLGCLFDSASMAVVEAEKALISRGFIRLDPSHLLQIAHSFSKNDVPALLLRAAVEIRTQQWPALAAMENTSQRVLDVSDQNTIVNHNQERLGFWGFADSGFIIKSGRPRPTVTMTGDKYSLCGRPMTKLLSFIESELKIQIDPLHEFPSLSSIWCDDVDSSLDGKDLSFLNERFSMMTVSTKERVRHGTGHSQEDVFAIRSGASIRLPDAVVWPTSQDEVIALVQAAQERNWCLIPFGGGTNVSNATRCPEKTVEPRPIISVDMKEMKRLLWLNEEDGLVHVEAGITGKILVEELERRGFTMGHEPDSIEFSTLGGWIATKASGMKRNRYGNIEDIVMSVNVVTTKGVLWKGSEENQVVAGRVAEGFDVRSLITGSEGCLGIITSAVIRIWPLPEVRKFDSIVFPCFEDGLNFVRSLSKKGSQIPASVRLLDNAHFRLGQALRPDATSPFESTKEIFTKLVASVIMGNLDHHSVVCATIGYEGSHAEVSIQETIIKELAFQNGGIRLGSKVGKAGYDLTFMIAYLRDFAMTYHVLGESFETFVPWSKMDKLIFATKARIKEEHCARLLPGVPFVGCRVTQLYHEGACLYFYLCISFDGVKNASAVYSELETAARDEILKQGGSLSHHHGIGKHRATQLARRMSSGFACTLKNIKNSLDDDNIFGARNGPFAFATGT